MIRAVAVVVLALFASVMAGCGGSEPNGGSAAAVDLLSPQPDPFGIYELFGTSRNDLVVARALTESAGRCMQERGFSAPIAPVSQPASENRLSIELSLIFGVEADSAVEALGLAATFDAYNAEIGAPPAEPPGSEAEAWQLAYGGQEPPVDFPTDNGAVGIAPDGCQAEAYVAVFGELGGIRNEFLPAQLRNSIVDLAYAEPGLAGPVEDWRSCMSDEGWVADSPLALYRQLEGRFDPASEEFDGLDAATRAELDATAALKACDAMSGLHEAGWGIVRGITDRVTRDNAAQIENYRQAVQRSLDILGQG